MKIIAFGHTKSVGKNTASRFLATILRTQKHLNVVQVNFASKVKSICFDLYKHKGLRDEQYYEEHSDKKNTTIPGLGKSARDIWIHVGNTLRLIDDEVWIDYALNRVNCDVLLFADLRYPTEANKVKEKDGLCVKITNNRIPYTSDVADDALSFYDKWDYHLHNDGTLNELHDMVETFAKQIGLIDCND